MLFTGYDEGGTEKLFDFYAEGFQGEDGRVMWRRHNDRVFAEPAFLGDAMRHTLYVKWKKEAGRWVVEEIGYPSS